MLSKADRRTRHQLHKDYRNSRRVGKKNSDGKMGDLIAASGANLNLNHQFFIDGIIATARVDGLCEAHHWRLVPDVAWAFRCVGEGENESSSCSWSKRLRA